MIQISWAYIFCLNQFIIVPIYSTQTDESINLCIYVCIYLSIYLGVCPVLCSGRGEYKNGECKCQPGWKGKECHIRYEECEVSNLMFKARKLAKCKVEVLNGNEKWLF